MLNQFKALVLSFREAPVSVREKAALNQEDARILLQSLQDYVPAGEYLVLSTCNRTEVYYQSETDCSNVIASLLCLQKNVDTAEIKPFLNHITEHNLAVRHLFEVSLGLDSQVLGDMQIINQVKQAYQASADMQTAGPFIHRLLHAIFFANKRVVQETSFRDGASSISYLAADLLAQITEHIEQPRIMILGLGEIGKDVCKTLLEKGFCNISVVNRTLEKAQSFAAPLGIEAYGLDQLQSELSLADIVVSSATAGSFLVTPETLGSHSLRGKTLIDLSVPRSIDPAVDNLPGVSLYNIDELKTKTSEVLEKRMQAVPQVRTIVDEALEQFTDWAKEAEISPVINRFKSVLEQMRQEELGKYLKGLDEKELEMMEKVTKGLMQRIIKLPVLQLKAACKRGNPEQLLGGLNDLFNLEESGVKEQ